MEQNNFLFYRSYYDSIKKLQSPDEQLELFLGICAYVFEEVEPELSFIPDILFTQIKANIDSGMKKREDGAKGGRPKKTKVIEEKNHGFENEKPTFFEEKTYGKAIEKNRKEKNRKEVEENTEKKNIKRKDIYDSVVDLYHECCPSLPKVSKLNDHRQKAINARLEEYTLDELREIFTKAEKSNFLKQGQGTWTGANFDWIMNPTNICKIAEGNYDNKGKPEEQEEEHYYGYIYIDGEPDPVKCTDYETWRQYNGWPE